MPDTGRQVIMSRPMELIEQYPVQGVATFAYHCTGCNGKAHVQQRVNPQTGLSEWVQVQLVGSDAEYRPAHVRPGEQVQIPVAYTLGSSRSSQASRVAMAPLQAPEAGIRLDSQITESTMITSDHPLHPENLRRRMQPIPLSDFTGGR
jgi:hypothetical protein